MNPEIGAYGIHFLTSERGVQVDLLEAYASVEWAIDQIEVLKTRIGDWKDGRPYEGVAETDPETGEKTLIVKERRGIPLIVNAETGAIVNSIRSSLDVLVNVLARRAGLSDRKDVRFPICSGESEFMVGKHAGRKSILRLLKPDQDVIKNLKPYKAGDDLLYALHLMDIERKHRRLLAVHALPSIMSFTKWGSTSDLHRVYRGQPLKEGTILAKIASGSDYKVRFTLEVIFSDAGVLTGSPLVAGLNKLARHTRDIIDLFDYPSHRA